MLRLHATYVTQLLVYCAGQEIPNSTMTLGHRVLHNFGIHQDAYLYWLGVGMLAGYVVLFNTLYTLTLTYLDRKLPAPILHSPVELSCEMLLFDGTLKVQDGVQTGLKCSSSSHSPRKATSSHIRRSSCSEEF